VLSSGGTSMAECRLVASTRPAAAWVGTDFGLPHRLGAGQQARQRFFVIKHRETPGDAG
jgi:hypothetical protein